MKIVCGCCKKLIDTEKHDFCPKCGANFNYSQALKVTSNAQDYEKFERKLEEERRNYVEQNQQSSLQSSAQNTPISYKPKKSKGGCCAGCFVALVFFLCVGLAIIAEISDEVDLESFFEEVIEESDYIDNDTSKEVHDSEKPPESESPESEPENELESINPEHFILAGETAQTEDYSVTCTEVSFYENMIVEAPEGSWYVAFDITIKNTTERKQFFYPGIKCFVDDKKCNILYLTGMFMPGELEAGEEYSKSVVFEVPEDSIFFDLYIEDTVAIFTSIADIESLNPESYD